MQDSDQKIALYLSQLEAESNDSDQSSSRIRALELLLKAHGAFIERVETVQFDGAFLADLTPAEPDPAHDDDPPSPKRFKINKLH
jgi:hypothetical protein